MTTHSHSSVHNHAVDLLKKISRLKTGGISALNGNTMQDTTLIGMRTASAKLVQSITDNRPLYEVRDRCDELSGVIDTGALVGIISQVEIKDFHTLIDNLRDEIDTEY